MSDSVSLVSSTSTMPKLFVSIVDGYQWAQNHREYCYMIPVNKTPQWLLHLLYQYYDHNLKIISDDRNQQLKIPLCYLQSWRNQNLNSSASSTDIPTRFFIWYILKKYFKRFYFHPVYTTQPEIKIVHFFNILSVP